MYAQPFATRYQSVTSIFLVTKSEHKYLFFIRALPGGIGRILSRSNWRMRNQAFCNL
jgi:hypothetical protein